MRKESKKKAKKKSNFTLIILSGGIGAVCGLLLVRYFKFGAEAQLSPGKLMLVLGLVLLSIYVGMFLQIIIHESGHLVFGLLSGYRFSSFRIGSLMWMKDRGKIKLRRMSLAGTGGQCLMSPPDMADGKMPFVLYNLGGSIMNVAASLLFLGAYALFNEVPYLSLFLMMVSIVGFGFALTNGIPLQLKTINNDGYNAKSLGKNPDALYAFWLQLKINEQCGRGLRLRDMPEEWFTLPGDDGMKNSMIAARGVFAVNRRMDVHAFEEAKTLIDRLLSMESGIVGLHRGLLICDRIYCALLDGEREGAEKLYSTEQRRFMRQMRKFPTVLRTAYAYALLHEQDAEKAQKIKAQFEKYAKNYPYAADIEGEREMMQIAEEHVL